MASLPSPMRRRLAVVDDDGDGAKGNDDDDGATGEAGGLTATIATAKIGPGFESPKPGYNFF